MKVFNIFILVFSIFFSFIFQLFNYKVLSEHKKIIFSFKKFLIFIFCLLFVVVINLFDVGIFKPYLAFLSLLILNKNFFMDDFNILVNTTIFGYAIAVIIEILISCLNNYFNIMDFSSFNDNFLLVLTFSFITNFISFSFCRYVKIFKKFLNKINKVTSISKYKIYITVLFLCILLIIDFRYVLTLSIFIYILNIFLVVSVLVIFIAYLYNDWKIKSELDKVDILLNNITKYEKIIDNNRMNNHEILNNLILLKSFKNKNTKKYEKILDDLIVLYDKDDRTIKNISNLPKGIKGIIYYKLDDLDKYNINICINISNRISSVIDKIDSNDYILLCKILPILLDNSIYACKMSSDKFLLLEIYKKNDSIIFSIENSCAEFVSLEKINNKYFTTKGNGSGLGLYIVNKLLLNSNSISLCQEYKNNNFVSKIIYKC